MTWAGPTEDLIGSLLEMIELAQIQFRDACVAFEKRDAELAGRVLKHDAAISGLHSILFKEILQGIAEQDQVAVGLIHLLYVIKNLEKIGDHATEIASSVVALSKDQQAAQLDRP
ncbi:phosphate signaling complex PhoU family protein [Stenotrophomonas forensis]|uniref:PhoU domain-containing protein n=1 Tax=Stenotrophomonas forensis TaxID=2871169 RepID=A0ABY7XW29_9GAMM|nr:PhoU domain-containing protein [Stenotrophomonas sp. DFS-20110405]WDM61815.1 PhoU domain-containing protein [Stenotrophomonas sp. DFS-20110405]